MLGKLSRNLWARRCGTLGLRSCPSVSTWSPLATAFNTKPHTRLNITKNDTGLFGISALTNPEGFYLLKENAIHRTDELIEEATREKRSRKMVEIFDELSDTLCKVADLAEFVRLSHPHVKFLHAAEDACISISGIVEKLNTDRELYRVLKAVVDSGDAFPTNPVDDHVAELFLFDFEQSGIHLEEKLRRRVVHLNECILQLGQRFMAGAITPRVVDKEVLPENIRHFFTRKGDKIEVASLFAESTNAKAREAAFRLFLYPDQRQDQLLTDILAARHELATICGFPTYAHRALKSSTVEKPDTVREFLEILTEGLRPRAEEDFRQMAQMKRQENQMSTELAAWDTPYYTAKLKKELLQVNAKEFAPYFSLGACMEGLNTVTTSLYGIHLENTEMQPGEAWNTDIYKLAVVHESEGTLGYIYCDFFERHGKPNQDCHFTIQGGKRLPDGTYQPPIVVIMLNLQQPRWSGPTLLTPSMVDNLFHEMGHAMHSMLARTEYQHVTGTRCSTDFAEIPSVLMEYFAADPRVLATFARHYQTHEPMPQDMLNRLCASKFLFTASETQLQVFYSALDQAYHGDPTEQGASTTDTLRQLQERYYGLPYVNATAWQLRFSHLIGYGAKYYSYLVSRAVASSIWHTFFAKDPLSRAQGERYRREFLSFGGGVPSGKLVGDFLQCGVTPQILAKNLIEEVDANSEIIRHLTERK
ncbi:mitochondrial intermediate peptidase [Lutzomyia longipalpis]|uniref:mitochondrial intermediate peptidase n=1 Tax=Lutzomyia longipalpis TaxID=7200 RepID=UPI002483704A|nr:mitochondrial intermediate peptidase [Lutzomyia longipalpis]